MPANINFVAVKQLQFSTDSQQKNTLKIKTQLTKLIVTTNNKPDHLAINIYWDTLRSWYTPRKFGDKTTARLKTHGIFLNYTKLSQTHGVSQETIRKKLVKLEKLGLVQRSFQHKETAATKSFNQLIIYVWQQTPHFFNPYGIDRNNVKELIPQTNHKYVFEKYNINFGVQTLDTNELFNQRGIQQLDDTKELIQTFSKEKDRSTGSNFCKNNFDFKEISKNQPTNTNQITKFFKKQESRELKDFHPLSAEDWRILQERSKREFSLNAMNEILLDMSRRVKTAVFYSKKGFISYMSKAFMWEKRDAVKISNESFKIRNNHNQEGIFWQEKERFLSEIERNRQISPEWHLKKKLASIFARDKAYELLRAYRSSSRVGEVFEIHLNKYVELTNLEREIILSQVKATHEKIDLLDLEDKEFGFINKLEIIMPGKARKETRCLETENEGASSLPDNIWGRVRKELISKFYDKGKHIDNNWFSKLVPVINDEGKMLTLKAPSNFIRDWIKTNYLELIESITQKNEYRVTLC